MSCFPSGCSLACSRFLFPSSPFLPLTWPRPQPLPFQGQPCSDASHCSLVPRPVLCPRWLMILYSLLSCSTFWNPVLFLGSPAFDHLVISTARLLCTGVTGNKTTMGAGHRESPLKSCFWRLGQLWCIPQRWGPRRVQDALWNKKFRLAPLWGSHEP